MKKATNNNLIHFQSDVQLRACLIFTGYLVKGHLDEFDFEAVLLHDATSEAIHAGHIVKLEVECMDGDKHYTIPRPVAFYDRKWVDEPHDYEQKSVDDIIALLDCVRIGDCMTDK